MKSSYENLLTHARFELAAQAGCRAFVVGTFNNWNPTASPMRFNPDSGRHEAQVQLLPGLHEYKFIIDGTWCLDPACTESVPNAYGSRNSVRHVKATPYLNQK